MPKKSSPTNEAAKAGSEAGRLSDQLCFALYAATNAVTRTYRPFLNELGLTYPQFLVMLVLWEHDARRLGEIADDLLLATHAVSPIIDRLEEAGLVRRVKDESDGRAIQVELTKAGKELEAEAVNVQEEVRCRTMLENDEVVELRARLHELVARMNDE